MGDIGEPPGPEAPPGPAPERDQAPPRIGAAVVVGGVILIALIAFAFYRRNTATAPTRAPEPAAGAPEVPAGTPVTAVSVHLSPEAAIATERYRCVCSCNDPLSVCTCTQTPGSIDMKQTVQDLVDRKKTPAEMDAAMVAKYGDAVLLSNPPAANPARPAAGSPPPAGNR